MNSIYHNTTTNPHPRMPRKLAMQCNYCHRSAHKQHRRILTLQSFCQPITINYVICQSFYYLNHPKTPQYRPGYICRACLTNDYIAEPIATLMLVLDWTSLYDYYYYDLVAMNGIVYGNNCFLSNEGQ